MRAPISLCLLLVLPLIGCSRGTHPMASPSLAEPVAAPMAAPMPLPPSNAAQNLSVPARLEDGGYATPNRDLSEAATIWHVRSALNVAALACPNAPILTEDYNRLLAVHRAALAGAYGALSSERRGDLDGAMTRVYNYFAQPPAQPDFCAVAAGLLARAAAVPPAQFAGFAREALPQLDAPFVAFYRAYDAYRTDLALWRAGRLESEAPHIAYDAQRFLRDDAMAGGEPARIVASR